MGICRGGGDKGLSEKPRPLDALLSRARAWEIESREGAVRSSSSESDRQMGSGGEEEEGGLAVGGQSRCGGGQRRVGGHGERWFVDPKTLLNNGDISVSTSEAERARPNSKQTLYTSQNGDIGAEQSSK